MSSDSDKYFHLPAIFVLYTYDYLCISCLKYILTGITFGMHVYVQYVCVYNACMYMSMHAYMYFMIQT